jgi:PAS domain S-box-containing protein
MDKTATPASNPDDQHQQQLNEALLHLRARADKRRDLVTQATEHHTPKDMQRLVLELQTHQIELEMQYEELLLAQAEADQLRLQYTDLYEFAPVGYLTLNTAGTISQLNLCASQLLGGPRQRLLNRRFLLFVAPVHRDRFRDFIADVLASARTRHAELELLREDGRPFFVQLQGLARPDAYGRSQCQLAIIDVDERRRTTDALAASEARFRATFEQSNDGMVLLDDYRFANANAAAAHLLGFQEPRQLIGQPVAQFWPERQPDGRRSMTLFADCMARAAAEGWCRLEWRRYNAAGEEVWDELSLSPVVVGGQAQMHGIWRDITAQRRAEAQLRHEKEFSDSLLEHSIDAIVALDPEGRVTAWNARAAEYAQLSTAEALGQSVYSIFPKYDLPEARNGLARILAGHAELVERVPFCFREGHFDAFLVPIRNHSGTVSGVLCIIRDVTERDRLAEEATQLRLRQQQEVLAAILETQETERKRIAEALHNGLGQLLYATKLSLEGHPGSGGSPAAAQKLLKEAIQTTRQISFELTPGILEDFGLRVALEELAKRIAPRQLQVRLHLTGLEQPLPAPVEIAVYRIVQELLNNVMKHAQATEVRIYVVHEDHRLELTVEDNGRGFDTTALTAQPLGGIGLAGVRNRALLLGGTLNLKSHPGKGTIVSMEVEV